MSTPDHVTHRIVVGVDASASSRAAVTWAARQAQRRRCDLIITHIDPVSVSPVAGHAAATSSRSLLAASATAASSSQPNVPVTSLLLEGSVSDELIRLSASALLLVIGIDEARPRSSYGALGAVEDRVVMHADCPVVTVSGRWDGMSRLEHRVVVGWSDELSSGGALQEAAAEAQLRNAPLTIVLDTAHLSATIPEAAPSAPGPPARLAQAVDSVRRTHPALAIDIKNSVHDYLQELIRQTTSPDLVVIGCPHSDDRWSIRVGVTADTMMREAACPVMFVGKVRATPRPNGLIATKQPGLPPPSGQIVTAPW
jgi:nucleotide-binding universal stress UspA family protein